MTIVEAITDAIRTVDTERRIEISDHPRVPLCPDVPRVVFLEPEDFAAGFEPIKNATFGNRELIQVYLKRAKLPIAAPKKSHAKHAHPHGRKAAADDAAAEPTELREHYVAEFAIPR